VASKVAASSNRRRDRALTPEPECTQTENVEPDEPSYRVELGDTVSEIAIRHGLPTAHVLAQNGSYGFELLQKPYSIEQLSRVLHKVGSWRTGKRGAAE
jgi:LysM repeat protein